MKYYCLKCIFLLTLVWSAPSIAQEQIGLRTGLYKGITSATLNPAHPVTSRHKWDIHLVSGGLFLQNSYGYLANTNVFDAINRGEDIRARAEFDDESEIPEGALLFELYENQKSKYSLLNAFIHSPGFFFKLGGEQSMIKHSIGFLATARTNLGTTNTPWELDYNVFEESADFDTISIDAFQVGGLAWATYMLNYGISLPVANGKLSLGINAKLMHAYEGFYLDNARRVDIVQLPGDSVSLGRPDFRLGYSSGVEEDNYSPSARGRGIGFDIGATYTIDEDDGNYSWRFGASIIDIGKVTIDENARMHRLFEDTDLLIDYSDYNEVETADELIERINEDIYGVMDQTFQDDAFSIGLPTALTLEADYQPVQNVFVHALLVQRLSFSNESVKRGNLFAITPRYENRWVAAYLPISLYNYRTMRMGAALRLAFLTVGTEDLGSFLGSSNLDGTDIYFGLNVNPFSLGFGKNKNGRKGKKEVKCYDF